VEWDLVDYGPGKFHVVSYQAKPAAQAAPVADAVDGPAAEPEGLRLPDCFFYRCWSAFRTGCNSAA